MTLTPDHKRRIRTAARKAGWFDKWPIEYDKDNLCMCFGDLLSMAAGKEGKQFFPEKRVREAALAAAAVLLGVEP